jgi:hypothetical protein
MIEGWSKADLEIAGALDGTTFYPCQMPKFAGALYGSKFAPGSEVAAEYSRVAQENVYVKD